MFFVRDDAKSSALSFLRCELLLNLRKNCSTKKRQVIRLVWGGGKARLLFRLFLSK